MRTRNKTNRRINKTIKKGGKSDEFKKMNCSPLVDKATPVKGSCFTADVLELLKKSYNKHNPNNLIKTNNPIKIWKLLKHRMRTCNKEDCWLEEIEDLSVRKKLDEYIFAPDHPDDWKDNPDEWLSNFDIMDVLKQYMKKYPKFHSPPPTSIDFDSRPSDLYGECVSNEICTFNLEQQTKRGKTKFGFVFNMSPHTSSGSHWVSLYVDIEDKFIFYMDSAGNKIPKQINTFVERLVQQGLSMSNPIKLHYYENCPLEHQMGTTECGMFTLFFLITMITNKAEGKVLKNYVEKIKFFKNKRIPDKYVFRFRKIYFNEK
jgi:hypothetical protein